MNDNTASYLFQYFIDSCSKLDFHHEYIDRIIFADEENYGKEIKNINPDDDFTNSQSFRGFGKTIYLQEIDKSIIIFRIELLQLLIIMTNENSFDKLENQVFINAFLHEISHCKNHYIQKYSVEGGRKSLKINEIPKHYFDIIIDEYNTNRNIIVFIKKEWVFYQLKNNLIEFNSLSETMLNFQDIIFVQNIWFFFKVFMDIGVFLIDYDLSEYIEILSILNLPFDIKLLISCFTSYNQGIISRDILFTSLSSIVNKVLKKYYRN